MPRDRLPPIEFEPADNVSSSSSLAPEPGDEHARHPLRWLLAGAAVVGAVVVFTVLDQPAEHASPIPTSAPSVPIPTSAPLSPTTTAALVPPRFATSTYLFDLATGGRIWPPPVVEGFMVGDTAVSGYVPSADGTRVLAFTHCALTAPCPGSDRLAVGKIDGSDVRTIAVPDGRRAVSADWSPDGTKIVYAARDAGNREEVFIEDLTTGATNQITHFERPGASLSPTFTLDGQSVLFMLPRGQYPYSDVWSMPVTGGEPTLVIENAEFPEPLPDGTIAFARFFWSGLWVTSIDDPGSARPLIPPREMVNAVAASPDGRRLAYVRPWVGPSPAEQGAVIIVDADNGGVETVLDRAISAEWLDNETLIFTELTPVDD